MKVVWKVNLTHTPGITEVQLPVGAIILSVQNQYDTLALYVEVDTTVPIEKHRFLVVETGKELINDKGRLYIGSALFFGGDYVLHIFLL